MKIKIDKGVPLPARRGQGPSDLTQTLRGLKVGDSFVYPNLNRSNIFIAAGRVGIKVATRANGSSIRVWRVK